MESQRAERTAGHRGSASGSAWPAARRAAALAALTGSAAVVLVAGAVPAAHADLDSEITAARQQLDVLTDRSEAAAEAYNAARLELSSAARAADQAQQLLDDAGAGLRARQADMDRMASGAYRGGSAPVTALTSLSSSDGPQSLLDKMGMLSMLSRREGDQIRLYDTARQQRETAHTAAAQALTARKAVTNRLDGQRRGLQDDARRQQDLLGQLQQRQAELVRQRALAVSSAPAAQRAPAQQALEQARAEQVSLDTRAQQVRQAAVVFSAAPVQAQAQLAAAAAPAPAPRWPEVRPARPAPAAPAAPAAPTAPAAPAPAGNAASVAVRAAYAQLGKPYVWGGAGPAGFDCSGLVQYAYAQAGVRLDHYTGSQWGAGRAVGRDQLQPGDLVFYYADVHHVGIYVGAGQMIEAPYTGASVRLVPLRTADYAGARRVA